MRKIVFYFSFSININQKNFYPALLIFDTAIQKIQNLKNNLENVQKHFYKNIFHQLTYRHAVMLDILALWSFKKFKTPKFLLWSFIKVG